MIVISGTMDVEPAASDAIAKAIEPLVTATTAEDGCLSYSVTVDVSVPGRFHVHEQWAGEEVLEVHRATPHMAAFQSALRDAPLLASELTLFEITSSRSILSYKKKR